VIKGENDLKTGLVIEDNEDNMILICRLLNKYGYRTLGAGTGKEGFEMIKKELPDFVILDIQLPDINGTEVLKMIREDQRCKDIPVIAVTSYAMAGDKERLLEAGCNGYIEKPISPAIVITQIKNILNED